MLMITTHNNSLEQKIISCFDQELNGPFFENNFKLSLSNSTDVRYNLEENSREFDIMIYGKKRLNIGLLINETYNIEIEVRKCSNGVINSKYDDSFLFSVILVNGESNAAHDSKKVYSLIDFKENYKAINFDFRNKMIPSIKNNERFNLFNNIKKYVFIPRVVNNNCEFLKNKLGENNILPLESILGSNINLNLKKGLLYFLCDNLLKDYKLTFIPDLMQVSFRNKFGLNNVLIDSKFNRDRVLNQSVSKSYEKYLTKRFNKKTAKALHFKNFSFITPDLNFANSCKNSEINNFIVIRNNILEHGLTDYIEKII
jgi:hypothetical protein